MSATRRTLLAAIGAAGVATLGGSMTAQHDLAKMLAGGRAGPPNGVRFAIGKLLAWDPSTFENQVQLSASTAVLANVPVLASPAALSLAAGQTVSLYGWSPTGGVSTWGILGSWVTPGSGAAAAQVQFLQNALAKQISAEIFAERVHAAENPASGGTSSAAYTEVLAGGDGPILTDIEVSEVGLAIVGVQAQISIIANPGQTNTAFMSYRVTGATERDAFDVNAKRTDIGDTDEAHITNVTDQSMSWSLQSGLSPGLHNFETMYRANYAAAFAQRRIIVIAL